MHTPVRVPSDSPGRMTALIASVSDIETSSSAALGLAGALKAAIYVGDSQKPILLYQALSAGVF